MNAAEFWDKWTRNSNSLPPVASDSRAPVAMRTVIQFAEAFAAAETERADRAACSKQFHMYVWTKEPFFYSVAQAESVGEARQLMLDEIGSGDGSCPEREKAATWVREQSPYIFHRENATFGLTDSAEIAEMSAYTEKLQAKLKAAEEQRDRAERERDEWKHTFEMYRSAWLRSIGGVIVRKSHEIDGFVLRTEKIFEQSKKWIAHENGVLLRDPFFNVPEPAALSPLPVPPPTLEKK